MLCLGEGEMINVRIESFLIATVLSTATANRYKSMKSVFLRCSYRAITSSSLCHHFRDLIDNYLSGTIPNSLVNGTSLISMYVCPDLDRSEFDSGAGTEVRSLMQLAQSRCGGR